MELHSRITGIVTEKDCNSVITRCNDVFLHYAGANSMDDVIGRTDYDFPWNNYADVYRKHEVEAVSGNNYSAFIPFKIHNGETLIFLHTKAQKKDKEGTIIGVSCHAVEIINPDMSHLIEVLQETGTSDSNFNQYNLGKQTTAAELSYRQSEILFYYVRGKTSKIIARILGLSNRTVEHHIQNLKLKLNCRNKAELIDFSISHGFMDALPFKNTASALIKKLDTK